MTATTSERLPLSTVLFVCICSILPFVPGVRAGFLNWDDTLLMTANPAIHGIGWPWIAEWFSSFVVKGYHPIVLFTYAIDHLVAGYEPMVFHATNILLHGLNSMFVLLLLHRFVRDRMSLAFAVLLFAIHPLRVEPVLWLSGRSVLLSTFFVLSSVMLSMRYLQDKRGSSLAFSFLMAVLASLSSPIAVVIPFLSLAAFSTSAVRSRKQAIRSLIPFFALAVVTAAVSIFAHFTAADGAPAPTPSLLQAITLPFWNIIFYAWKTILPMDLSAVYPFPENGGPDLLMPSLLSLVTVCAAAILVLILKPGKPITFGIAWTLICLAPVLQWIPVGPAFAADRFTYLSSIGLSLLAGILLDRTVHRKKGLYRPIVRRAGIIVLAVLGTVSFVRTDVWKDSVSLWTSVLELYPDFAEGHLYIGSAFATEERNIPLAIAAFTESIRLDDRNANAYSNRALAVYQSTDPDTARIIPDLQRAIALAPHTPEHQVFLAEVYHTSGMTQRAFDISAALLDIYPSLHRARFLHLRCALELGFDDAVQDDIRILGEAGIDVSVDGGSG